MEFPARAYIQEFDTGHLPPDYALVAEELKNRGIHVIVKSTEQILRQPLPLTRNDLVVGNFDWTKIALQQLRIEMPRPPDYPHCLRHLLKRHVWRSTLGEVQLYLRENASAKVFIKPAENVKAFAAIVEPKDQMLDTLLEGIPDVLHSLPATFPVYCSDVVDMISEYRAYVVAGTIRSICQYRGPKVDSTSPCNLNREVVQDAVRALFASEEGKELTGCALDFAVLRQGEEFTTCLVEVNDGYSLGRYEGISGVDYTDLLIARWRRLMAN
jgi:hypothetical protein